VGLNKRHQKNQSFQSHAKGFAKSSAENILKRRTLFDIFFGIFATCGFVLSLSCSQSPKQTLKIPPSTLPEEASSSPDFEVTALGLQLTRTGENDSPSLSPDGKKLAFIARNRPSHTHGQVYILDLETRREKRVTFQDGDCFSPVFLKNGKQLVYASTTDELKEKPVLFQKKSEAAPWPPADLYLSDTAGTTINRLTHRAGFDGQPWPRLEKSLVFAQANNALLEAWQIHIDSKKSIPLLTKKDKSVENLRFSPDNKQAIWIERSPDQLMLAPANNLHSGKALKLPVGSYRDISWVSNQKVFFSAQTLKKFYQIYSYDVQTNCLQNLVESTSNLFSPQLASEGAAVIFTSQPTAGSQIFYKSLTASDQCLKWEEIEIQNQKK
jgi:Tol biopolymer transport system component